MNYSQKAYLTRANADDLKWLNEHSEQKDNLSKKLKAPAHVAYPRAQAVLYELRNDINRLSNEHPVEFSKRIVVSDASGIQSLVSEIMTGSETEWGSVLKLNHDKETTDIYSILLPEEAEEDGFIESCSEDTIVFNYNLILKRRFNGDVHYHPDCDDLMDNAIFFSVHARDRVDPKGFMNLLCFRYVLPSEPFRPRPMILAYNHIEVYYPNKDFTEFTPMNHMQVVQLLSN